MKTPRICKKLVMSLMVYLLLAYCIQELSASSREICKLCHANATCSKKDDKYFCQCNYGLIGNGMTQCWDKDECKIGAHRICGNHTFCHNTHGSFYCVCLAGYRPSNNHHNFIPNDGTFCTDIDECDIQGICGDNSICKNIPGSYECFCKEGYTMQEGQDQLHKNNNITLCSDIDECDVPDLCGSNSQCKNIPGSYECYCKEGYRLQNGTQPWQANNMESFCTAVDCGPPPAIPNSISYLEGNTLYGGQVTYECSSGYRADEDQKLNRSLCTENGTWQGSSLYCKVIDCGYPPTLPNSILDLPYKSTFGSMASYRCAHGFSADTGQNTSFCTNEGKWSEASMECKAVDCGSPPVLPNSIIDRLYNSTFGSMVTYRCSHGFTAEGSQNTSFCTAEGQWTEASAACKEVDCGMPSSIQHADMIWKNQTVLGSSVVYVCRPGFKEYGEKNVSFCTAEAVWEEISMTCSVKDDLIHGLFSFNNTCIQWKKSSEISHWKILYKFSIHGARQEQKDFVTVTTFNYTTDEETPTVCLELLPDTNYTVTITALSSDILVKQMNITVQTPAPNTREETVLGSIPSPSSEITEKTTIPLQVKERFDNIAVFNKTCLQWTRTSEEEDSLEVYMLFIQGKMWKSEYLLQNIRCKFSTKKKITVLCLDLPPAAEYSINVTELSTDISNYVHLNISADENEGASSPMLYNEVCWNKSVTGLQEVYKLYLHGISWYTVEMLPELIFNISTVENTSACLDLPVEKSTIAQVTENPVHQNIQSTTAVYAVEYFSNLTLINETCLTWRRPSRINEMTTIFIHGLRPYEKDFVHKVNFNVTTQEEIPVLCLELESGTNYTVILCSTVDQQQSAQINIMTKILDPPLPKLVFVATHGRLPTISFSRVEDKYGPISSYQVFVVHLVSVCSCKCESLEPVAYFSNKAKAIGYMTAEFFPHDVMDSLEFSVGDRKYYGEFYNAPLARGKDYCIILRIISRWNKMKAQSCIVLTEIRDLHPLRNRMAEVLLVSMIIVIFVVGSTYCIAWCCRR
uniref:Sushi domain containing 1 n=1 Tax=Leptobrachium leishanense TaxID=445787 RepID=A0A8C5M373_9ANUR